MPEFDVDLTALLDEIQEIIHQKSYVQEVLSNYIGWSWSKNERNLWYSQYYTV